MTSTTIELVSELQQKGVYVAQFKTKMLAVFAYYVESNGEAYLIDPTFDYMAYKEFLEKRGAVLKYVVLTHYNADFISGNTEFKVPVVMGPGSKRPVNTFEVIQIEENQSFTVGKCSTRVIGTPGHTLESSCFILSNEQNKEFCIFTGDTVFLREVGQPDLTVASILSTQDLAGMLFDSIQKIKALDGNLRLYPGHGSRSACGKSIGSGNFCDLKTQGEHNYAFLITDRNQFIEKVSKDLPAPPNFFHDAKLNQQGINVLYDEAQKKTHNPQTVEELETHVKNGVTNFDTRHIIKEEIVKDSHQIYMNEKKTEMIESIRKSCPFQYMKNTQHPKNFKQRLQKLNVIQKFIRQNSDSLSSDLNDKFKYILQIKEQIIKKQKIYESKLIQLSKLQEKDIKRNNQIQIQSKQKEQIQSNVQEKIKKIKIQIENKKIYYQISQQKIQKQIQKCKNETHQIQLKRLQLQDQNIKLTHKLQKQQQKYQNQKFRLKFNLLTAQLIKLPLDFLQNEKKKLNDELQQMKGNIRVYCRIRPLYQDQKQMNYELKSHDLLVIKKSFQNKKSQNMKTDFQFVFDRVFDQATTQDQVFGEISQLVQSVIDGKNVCIFAYGQTGSGKTFTMQGKKQPKQSAGVILRSIELIFQQLLKDQKNHQTKSIAISTNQIYNDTLVNLLTKSILKSGKPVFTNVTSIKQVQDQLHKALSNRSTAFTLSNADSSRSHLIFVIRITQKKVQTINGQEKLIIIQNNLVLIDLAGSQRVKQSKVTAQRLKEAQHINNSLSQLGQVLKSLKSKKNTFFRNCTLTNFLRTYLQKRSKAVMFVNISPALYDESQTIYSLEFAVQAKETKLDK